MEIVQAKTILCLSIFFCLWRRSNCTNLLFQYDNEQCLNQVVEYQCTVTGSGLLVLTWRVLDNNGTELDGQSYTSNVLASGTDTIGGGVFTVEQLSTSPLVSNISFTVQSSINGYTIICEDGITMNNKNFTINIKGPPPPSTLFISDTLCDQVNISWTKPSFSSHCFPIIVSYTVNSNTTNSTINTTDTSVTISLDGLSAGVYCVSVAAVDTANRTGEFSEEICFLKVFPKSSTSSRHASTGAYTPIQTLFRTNTSSSSSSSSSSSTSLPSSSSPSNTPTNPLISDSPGIIFIIIGVAAVCGGGLIACAFFIIIRILCIKKKIRKVQTNDQSGPHDLPKEQFEESISTYSHLQHESKQQQTDTKIGYIKPDIIPIEKEIISEYSSLQLETSQSVNLAHSQTKKANKSKKPNQPPPKFVEGVKYAAVKHKVEYADVSTCQKGQAGHVISPLPQQSVTYSSVMQKQYH